MFSIVINEKDKVISGKHSPYKEVQMLLLVILNNQEIRGEKDYVLIDVYNQKSSIVDFDFF